MDIHPPSGHVGSVKDFLIHMSMITIGILIALGLEQAVEAWHHHELGVEARENIVNELRDNKKEMDGERTGMQKNRDEFINTLRRVRQFLAHEKLEHAETTIRVSAASLNSTSWTTASATGALAYMGYDQAKKFASAYELQGMLLRLQEDGFRKATEPFAIISPEPGGPDKLTDDQLRTVEREVTDLLGTMTLWDQLAAQLSKGYALKGE